MTLTWGQPAALWLLLCVLLLLLIKPKRPHQRISVGTLHLWTSLQAAQTPSRARRFRRPPMFVLHALVITALVLALADPGFSTASSDIAVVLDTSMSMGARDGATTRLDVAKERVATLIRSLPRGGRARVYLAGSSAAVLGDFTKASGDLPASLATVRPSDTTAEISSTLAKAKADAPSSAIYVITDARDRPAVEGVTWMPVGTPAENVALTAMEAAHELDSPHVSLMVAAANYGATDVDADISITRDDAVLATRTVHIRANGHASTTFELTHSSGTVTATLNADDALAADNVRFALLDAPRRLTVQMRGDSPVVEHALSVHPRVEHIAALDTPPPDLIVCAGCSDTPNDGSLTPVLMVPSLDGGAEVEAPLVITEGAHQLVRPLVAGLPIAPTPLVHRLNERAVVARAGGQPVIAAYQAGERRIVEFRFDLATLASHGDAMLPLLMADVIEWLVPSHDVPRGTSPATTIDRAGVYEIADAQGPRTHIVNPPATEESNLAVNPGGVVIGAAVNTASRTSTPLRGIWLIVALALLAFEWRQRRQAQGR